MQEHALVIEISTERIPNAQDAIDLYLSVGWGNPDQYNTATWATALKGASCLITAYEDHRLVGLARVLSDGAHDSYISDIVVHPDFQRKGVGKQMLNKIVSLYGHTSIYLAGLSTPEISNFFEACGFVPRNKMFLASRRAQ